MPVVHAAETEPRTTDFCPYATQIHMHKGSKIPWVSRSSKHEKFRGHSQAPKTS